VTPEKRALVSEARSKEHSEWPPCSRSERTVHCSNASLPPAKDRIGRSISRRRCITGSLSAVETLDMPSLTRLQSADGGATERMLRAPRGSILAAIRAIQPD